MLTFDRLLLTQGNFRLAADFSLPPGGITALVGPSGAGKSTLLSAIAGFLTPAHGRILWQGQDLAALPPGARPLSILFQDQNLFPHLTVAQNLGLGLRPDLRLGDADRDRVSDALALVGLTGLADRKPGSLSGGQQSRVALARTLLRARPLLLLDEPFAALGPALRAEMLDLVLSLTATAGTSVLMVSHDPADALRVAARTMWLAGERLEPPTETAPLFANPPPALAAYLGRDRFG